MKRLLLPLFAVGFLTVAAPAHAALFTLSDYDVTVNGSDPGLVVWEKELLGTPFSFELNTVGQSTEAKLFRIGTNENALNADDLLPLAMTVSMWFTSPAPGFGGVANGVTGALWFLQSFGYATWDNPTILNFGTTGQLAVTLSQATFGLPGSADIYAKFTLKQADAPTAVPEPATAMLLGVGVALMASRRRQIMSRFAPATA